MTTAIDTRRTIVTGSLADVARQTKRSLAETFIGADAVVLVDTSGSMNTADSRGGHKRYEVACEELAALQAKLPGKLAVLSFSDQPMFCPAGKPYYQGAGTDMAAALKFAKVADVPGIQFILISDGEPDAPAETLKQARMYTSKIDTIYVGSEVAPTGRDFLAELAAASGGQSVTAHTATDLMPAMQKLLTA